MVGTRNRWNKLQSSSLSLILRVLVSIGTAINVVAVLAGGSLGTLVGTKLPEAMRHTAMQAIGIVTLLVGISSFPPYPSLPPAAHHYRPGTHALDQVDAKRQIT